MARKKNRTKRKLRFLGLFLPIVRLFRLALGLITKNLQIIIIAIILILIAKGTYNLLLGSDYFTVKEVEILRVEEKGAVADSSVRLQLEKGINIFKLSLKGCQRQIEQVHPEFKNIKVNRVLPDKIIVFFQKRIPVCQVKSRGFYLVSKDAVVLPNPKSRAQAGLPTVTGVYINESKLPSDRRLRSAAMHRALDLIQQIKHTEFSKNYKIAEIDVYDKYNPIIQLENGIQIKIGKRNFVKIEPALNEVLDDLESKGLRPKSIDLRFDDIVVTPR